MENSSKGKMGNKAVRVIGWVVSGLMGVMLLMSAGGKLSGAMDSEFERFGLEDWKIIIAIGEILSTVLFLIPRTQSAGTLLLSSYMGGAIVIHMSMGDPIIVQSAILVMIWIGSIMRNPQTLSSFLKQ